MPNQKKFVQMVESEHFNAGHLPFFTHLHLLHFHHIKQFETFPRNAQQAGSFLPPANEVAGR